MVLKVYTLSKLHAQQNIKSPTPFEKHPSPNHPPNLHPLQPTLPLQKKSKKIRSSAVVGLQSWAPSRVGLPIAVDF